MMNTTFVKCLAFAAVVIAALSTAVSSSHAGKDRWLGGEYRSAPAKMKRGRNSTMPIKDCRRYNGRWGYYGNPWCSPAEQRAFDVWDAERIGRLRQRQLR